MTFAYSMYLWLQHDIRLIILSWKIITGTKLRLVTSEAADFSRSIYIGQAGLPGVSTVIIVTCAGCSTAKSKMLHNTEHVVNRFFLASASYPIIHQLDRSSFTTEIHDR